MKKRLIAYLMALSMLATSTGTVFAADPDEEFIDISFEEEIQENQAFPDIEDIESSETFENIEDTEIIALEDAEGAAESSDASAQPSDYAEYNTGYVAPDNIPEIIDYTEGSDAALLDASSYPSSYTTALLPSLRSQGSLGLCWAFATVGLAEINALKKGFVSDINLSELHLAYFNSNSVTDPLGGTEGDYVKDPENALDGNNYFNAMNTLVNWMGLASEETVPYGTSTYVSSNGIQDELAYDDQVHVQNYTRQQIDFKNFRESGNTDLLAPIKDQVMKRGAVGISYHSPNGYSPTTTTDVYNPTYSAFYDNGGLYANHAVIIVGWDDNFAKEKFSKTPAGNGAWLIRNSWTTRGSLEEMDYAGYFWMSYYTNTIDSDIYSLEVEPASNYDNNYQYQLASGVGQRDAIAANVYTAHSEGGYYGEELKAVGIQHYSKGKSFTVKVYKNVSTTPDTGTLVPEATTTFVTDNSGFQTITLASPVRLDRNEKFAVVVEGDVTYAYNSDYPKNHVAAEEGQSYLYQNGVWTDHASSGNFVIKAFTDNLTSADQVLATDIEFSNIKNGSLTISREVRYKVKAKVLPAAATNKAITWSSSNPAVATVSSDGFVLGKKAGTTTITASVAGTSASASFDVIVENKLISLAISGYSIIFYPKYGIEFHAATTPSDYESENSIKWSCSDPDGIKISADGKADNFAPGSYIITAELDGITAKKSYNYSPDSSFYKYQAPEDKTVTFRWNRIAGEKEYIIMDGNRTVAIVAADGRSTYEVTDSYYVGKSDTSTTYTIKTKFGLTDSDTYLGSLSYNITFGEKPTMEDPSDEKPSDDDNKPTPPANPVKMKKVKIYGLKSTAEYTGAPYKVPEDLILYTVSNNNKQANPLIMSEDGITGDYVVEYKNNEKVGKCTVTFIGINGYTGSIKKTVTIKPYDIKKDKDKRITVTATDEEFAKGGVSPTTTVTYFNGSDIVKLQEGIDYTLSYKNNKKAGDKADKKAPTVVVKGKGNFKGKATCSFTIEKAPITSARLAASDVTYNSKGKKGYFLKKAKLYQNGKALTEKFKASDLIYTYAEDTVLEDGNERHTGDVVSATDKPLPGTKIQVSIPAGLISLGKSSSFYLDTPEAVIVGTYSIKAKKSS